MIKICKQKNGHEQIVKPINKKNISLIEKKQAKEKDPDNNEEEEEQKENEYDGNKDRRGVAKKNKDSIFKITTVDEVKNNSKRGIVQMKELKLIPTQIFWLQIISLLPLIPVLPLIFYPYYNYIHQFQIVWAASLLAFKSGARWTSATLQPKYNDVKVHSYNKKTSSWSWCESWGSLASAVTPAFLAAFALFLSFPSNHIILTYAFVRILLEDLSKKNLMPKGYLELEIFTCIVAVIAILFVFVINIVYLALE